MAEDKNIKGEVGSTFDYEKIEPMSLKRQEDKFEQIINSTRKYGLYDSMVLNEAQIGAFNNLANSYICAEEFSFKPADVSDEAKEKAEYMQQVLDDMETPFLQSMKDWLTFTKYGFSVNEILLKKRLGSNPSNPKKDSKYNDGLIGIRKFSPRPQRTIKKWHYDKYSRIETVEQLNPTTYNTVQMPYDRVLHFVVNGYNENPEGLSVFRSCAQAFYEKQKIVRHQAIRFERGFDGIPKITLPAQWCDRSDERYNGFRSWAEDTVSGLKQNQDAGIVVPQVLVEGKNAVEVEILSGDAPVGQDPDVMIRYRDEQMATALLSDFFLSGSGASISGTLGQVKISVFTTFLRMLLDIICDEFNKKVIPLIWEMNGFDKELMPKLIHSNLSKLELTNAMLFVQSLGKTGLFTNTHERENALVDLIFQGSLPHISEEDWKMGQKLKEVNTVNNMDQPTVESFDDVFNEDSEKDNK